VVGIKERNSVTDNNSACVVSLMSGNLQVCLDKRADSN
jgi:hypothetical protein